MVKQPNFTKAYEDISEYVWKLREVAPESNARARDNDYSLMSVSRAEFVSHVRSRFGKSKLSDKIIHAFFGDKYEFRYKEFYTKINWILDMSY